MATKLVRLTTEVLDAIRLHDPEHSPSQGILEMHRRLTSGIPPQERMGIQKVNLSDEDWEHMENLIKTTVKKSVKEAMESIPNKMEFKKEDNQFHTVTLPKVGDKRGPYEPAKATVKDYSNGKITEDEKLEEPRGRQGRDPR